MSIQFSRFKSDCFPAKISSSKHSPDKIIPPLKSPQKTNILVQSLASTRHKFHQNIHKYKKADIHIIIVIIILIYSSWSFILHHSFTRSCLICIFNWCDMCVYCFKFYLFCTYTAKWRRKKKEAITIQNQNKKNYTHTKETNQTTGQPK